MTIFQVFWTVCFSLLPPPPKMKRLLWTASNQKLDIIVFIKTVSLMQRKLNKNSYRKINTSIVNQVAIHHYSLSINCIHVTSLNFWKWNLQFMHNFLDQNNLLNCYWFSYFIRKLSKYQFFAHTKCCLDFILYEKFIISNIFYAFTSLFSQIVASGTIIPNHTFLLLLRKTRVF